MQFKAGYIVDSIAKVINDFKVNLDEDIPADKIKIDQINGLLQYVSSFDVEFPYKHRPDFKKIHPVLAVINNIITRGLPTRAPVALEELLANINLTSPDNSEFEIDFTKSKKVIDYETIFELLHTIEPSLEINRNNYGGNLGSDLEWDFIKNHPFLKQILSSYF